MTHTFQSALAAAAESLAPSPGARRDAELLLIHTTGRDRAWLLTHPETALSDDEQARFDAAIARRAAHEPIQYITGTQEFYGLAFAVTPAVLIPRPETEHLVEAALERIPPGEPARIADVGTGSGAIAVALAHYRPLAQVTALDISPAALAVARANAERHRAADRISFIESDLLAAVAADRSSLQPFDLIAANPPYVPDTDCASLEPQVRDWEPATALFAGPDGLDIYRRLIPQARALLKPNGWLLMEIGHGQEAALRRLLAGWREVEFIADLQGISRVAVARAG